jgi:solute carrier family 25 carnitine/acylcarnitine transporter 20/29
MVKTPMVEEAAINTISGTIAGVAQVAVGHPLDTIKIRMQTKNIVRLSSKLSTPASFDGIIPTMRTTVMQDGMFGLYKGAASPLCGAMLQNASGFLFWGLSKHLFQEKEDEPLTVFGLFKAGLLVGALCLTIENPIDLVKTQMQVQVGSSGGRYRSVFDCGAVILKQRGIQGLYQGVLANSLRFVPGRAIYLSTFEATNQFLQTNNTGSRTDKNETSYVRVGIAGGFAGGMAWISTYPFDVIRNIMMGDHIDPEKRKYKSILDCGRSVVKSDGMLGLWRGISACLLRAAPVNGCIFVVYTRVNEELTSRLSQK